MWKASCPGLIVLIRDADVLECWSKMRVEESCELGDLWSDIHNGLTVLKCNVVSVFPAVQRMFCHV